MVLAIVAIVAVIGLVMVVGAVIYGAHLILKQVFELMKDEREATFAERTYLLDRIQTKDAVVSRGLNTSMPPETSGPEYIETFSGDIPVELPVK